jgi:TolB-like protein/DNA-binding winged helix-turn-helix (wHTH) protein/Tfp pilus assembly protein PilF
MLESSSQRSVFEFGPFRVDGAQRLLVSDGKLVPIEPKVFDTLFALVEARGRLVSKEELLQRVWPGTFVEEGGLARNVSAIRRVLGEGAAGVQYIETIPKRGYRFVEPVRVVADERAPATAVEVPAPGSQVAPPGDPAAPVPSVDLAPAPHTSSPARPGFLAWIAAAALLVVAVVGGMAWRREVPRTAATTASPVRSLAVLPLQNLSGDPDQDYFADGTTEELIATLAQIDTLRVISRTSAMQYKGTSKSLPQVARELNVDAILEGSIQRSDGRVRITAQLVDGATDAHLWAKTFDANASDLLRVQADVARAVAEQIRARFTPDALSRLTTRPAVDPAAYEEVLRGHAYRWRGGEPAHRQAVAHYQRAIDLQPDYALAHAGLALALGLSGAYEGQSKRAAAARALALDPNLPEAHAAMATVEYNDWNWDAGNAASQRAMAINPGSLDSCYCYIINLATMGRADEAVAIAEEAIARNPLAVGAHQAMGFALLYARRYNDAIAALKRAIALDERNQPSYSNLSRAYAAAERAQEAVSLLEQSPLKHSLQMATAYAQAGRIDEARRVARDLTAGTPGVERIQLARYYLALGDKERALEELTESVNVRETRATQIIGVEFDSLRTDPRFKALVTKLRFPPSYDAFLAAHTR